MYRFISKESVKYILLGTGIFVLFNLEKNYYTGRYQLLLTPQWYMSKKLQEYKKSNHRYIEQTKSSNLYQALDSICSAITTHVGLDYLTFTLKIYKSEKNSATVLPDRTIIIHSGILSNTKNIDEFAFIFAHELSHFILNHSEEKFSQRLILEFLNYCLKIYLEIEQNHEQNLSHQKEAQKNFIFESPLGHILEYEADYFAVKVLEGSGFDVVRGAQVFKRFKRNHWLYHLVSNNYPDPVKRYNRIMQWVRKNEERFDFGEIQGDDEKFANNLDDLKIFSGDESENNILRVDKDEQPREGLVNKRELEKLFKSAMESEIS